MRYLKEWVDYGFEEEDNYNDFITDDEFRQFLIDNDCLDKYIENSLNPKLKDGMSDREFPKNFDTYYIRNRYNECRTNYIINAFNWSKSPEREYFWRTISDMWRDLVGYVREWVDYGFEEPEYDDFITDDKFRQFLINNNCYEQYIENSLNPKIHIYQDFIENFKTYKKSEYIGCAFEWTRTSQSGGYWANLKDKWDRESRKSN